MKRPGALTVFWFGVLMFVLVAADAACGSSEQDTDSGTAMRVGDLLGSPDPALEVTYHLGNRASGEDSTLVWRQHGGWTRLDVTPTEFFGKLGSTVMGDESLGSDESATAEFRSCDWNTSRSGNQFRMSCSTGERNSGGIELLRDALRSKVTSPLPDTEVAGRAATCYAFGDAIVDGSICFDDKFGVPLRLALICGEGPVCVSFEAEAFAEDVRLRASFPPVPMERNPVAGASQGEAVLDATEIDLPSAFTDGVRSSDGTRSGR